MKNLYVSPEDYLNTQLKLLDLRIYRYITTQNIEKGTKKNPFKGLAITEEEIIGIFKKEHKEKDIKIEALDRKINMLAMEIDEKNTDSINEGIDLRIEKLCSLFSLNYIVKNMIIGSVAAELDPKYEKLFGFINDNVNKKRPTFNTMINLMKLGLEERIAFRNEIAREGIISRFLLESESLKSDPILLSNEIKLDRRIIDYVLYNNKFDTKNYRIIAPKIDFNQCSYNKSVSEGFSDIIKNFKERGKQFKYTLFFLLYGVRGIGKKYSVQNYCAGDNKKLIVADIAKVLNDEEEFKIKIQDIMRESVLSEAVVYFENFEEIYRQQDKDKLIKEFFDIMEYFFQPIFISSNEKIKSNSYLEENIVIRFDYQMPDFNERKELWKYFSMDEEWSGEQINELSAKFKFTPLQIKNAIKDIKGEELRRDITQKQIYRCCHMQVENKLSEKAQKIEPVYSWEDLVLPQNQKDLLKDACNQAKNKYIVYEKWGFNKKLAYGKGLSVICSGPPGTGKTMSAQVLARELGLELYRVDLSQMVSKYVGETEKNLGEVFKEAGMSNSILFFDEADSLFGKRSDVKSSNDRYANIETSYLLQKIEEYDGISMMATNYLKNIDNAFLRRINYIIKYPFPNSESRKEIWKRLLSNDAPVDKEIDFDFLANKFELSGGNIKNGVVYAAFLAAEEKKKISMKHLLKSLKYELQKMDKLLLIDDFGEYKYLFK